MAIYYLEADDEITSAATRIRDSSDTKIALVLPAGSRVATSRINFILLGREARKRNKTLSVVTADPSTQSVARSADLAVFASVNEYERAQSARAANAATVAAGGSGAAAATTEALDELARTVATPATTPTTAPGPAMRKPAGSPSRTLASGSEGRSRVPWPAVAAVFALVIVLVSGGLFFIYPSASVVVALSEEPVGPLSLTVTVDPGATSVNDQTATIPGVDKAFPVRASGSFTATGEKVDDVAATGTVVFYNANNYLAVPVLGGTQVSTDGGVVFTTVKTITVPKATISGGSTLVRGTASVGVVAVQKGTGGNVAAGAINNLPGDLAAAMVSGAVTNPAPTTGGAHNVTPQIQQADVDLAAKELLDQLDSAFQDAMAAPEAVPASASLFDETAQMGTASCSPDPAGLVGQEIASFDMSCSATGTATIADLANVKSLAERRIKGMVGAGYGLVENSVKAELGTPTVKDGVVTVPVVASASQVRKVTVDQLRTGILGKKVTDAEAYLKGFGKTTISLTPSWADTMPSFDFRVDVELVTPTPAPTASPTETPSGSETPTERPTPRPTIRRTTEPTPEATGSSAIESASPTPASSGESAAPSATPSAPPPESPKPTPAPSATPTPTPAPSA